MGIMVKEHHIINLCYAPIIASWHCECRFCSVPGRTKNTHCIRTKSDAIGHVHRAALWEGLTQNGDDRR
jgi:hypothetical protein